jgi:hypothetical protein
MAKDSTNPASYSPPPEPTPQEKAKAIKWFEHAKTVADTHNYDYAIECYINGLGVWPEAVDEGHKPLRAVAFARLGAGGKTYTRTPFANNVIPASLINPVAANVAKYLPAANLVGDGLSHTNNYALVRPETNTYDSWLGKMDYHFSDRSTASFRYGQTPYTAWASIWGVANNPAEPTGEGPEERVGRNWGADWTHTITPTAIFTLRAGLARYEAFTGNKWGAGFDPRALGFSPSLVSQFTWLQFPRFNFENYSEVGATVVTSYETHDTWSLQPGMSLVHGRHFLKIGSEFRRYNDNNLQPGSASGVYAFTKGWTQANPAQSDSASGNAPATPISCLPPATTAIGCSNSNPWPASGSALR